MDKKIGELIQERVKSQKLDVTEFAKLINKERSNVYNIFNRSSIDTDLLKKIGQVLDYDFFQEFLEPETIQKILMTHSLDNEIYVKIKLSNSEMSKISLQEKVINTFIKE